MLVFAHRGASGDAPENTIKAMQLALEQGATAVELDIHVVEGELVVFHDRWLQPKSTGHGLIAEKTLQELAQFTVDGEPIPLLWDLMAALSPRPLVNIELKGDHTAQALIDLYPRLIDELGYDPNLILISSFDHQALKQVRNALPNILIAPLIEGIPHDLAAVVSSLNAYSLHLNVNFISKELVQDAHQRGAKVFVYTVDYQEDMKRLAAIGVDGIFTNYPQYAIEQIEKQYIS